MICKDGKGFKQIGDDKLLRFKFPHFIPSTSSDPTAPQLTRSSYLERALLDIVPR